MLVHAKADTPVVCPYPPAPQDSIFFYIADRVKVQKQGTSVFLDQPRSVVVGTQLTAVSVDVGRDHKAVRIGFHPGGLHRLLGLPMTELIDGHHDAEDVFGAEMHSLNERLLDCHSFDEIRSVVEAFLLRRIGRLRPVLPFDYAVLELLKAGGNLQVTELASLACVSSRQLQRICEERTGLSPRMLGRLIRFSRGYRMKERNPTLRWTQIAHDCGFFDQMHFIRDFRFFTGITPGDMERRILSLPIKLQSELEL